MKRNEEIKYKYVRYFKDPTLDGSEVNFPHPMSLLFSFEKKKEFQRSQINRIGPYMYFVVRGKEGID